MREGKAEKFENNTVFISFEEMFNFHKKRVEENRENIEKIISNLTGKNIKIEIYLKKIQKRYN